MKKPSQKDFISIADLAKALGISRIAVFKKVKRGFIPAVRVGRSYRISAKDVPEIIGRSLSARDRAELDKAVHLAVHDYGETLQLLGRE